MLKTMLTHAETWFKELEVGADHEYHKAVTQFLSWVGGEEKKVEDAIALLVSKGYAISAGPVAAPAPVAILAE